MLWWLLLACKVECEAGTHEEDGECVADPIEETDVPAPCEVSSWCLSGTMTFTTIADTVGGEENTRAFDDLKDVPITFQVGFEIAENYTEDDPRTARRVEADGLLTSFDPDPKGNLNTAAAMSLATGELQFFLVGDQPDQLTLLDGPLLMGNPNEPEIFQLRFTGGKLDQSYTDYPELLPFTITGTRVEIGRLTDIETETDFASGTADLTLAPAL
jgi:hypothetical protein